ncbi:hypothetical protein A1O1_09151 [Capronia coronata CBS 617.96]|uniref:Uncharacterized protein n=1 Tax=Capronia coronata CBS 617.96 TaxID=1182541 RepID=W9Y8L5_9EURO|nr:uncharacterized protein A1O1_09151 [Capronia coronata CBS 617.96]EXJ78749.1 hypothetical protein A1O1_09151 [Capronia coronata CBS 617.96]
MDLKTYLASEDWQRRRSAVPQRGLTEPSFHQPALRWDGHDQHHPQNYERDSGNNALLYYQQVQPSPDFHGGHNPQAHADQNHQYNPQAQADHEDQYNPQAQADQNHQDILEAAPWQPETHQETITEVYEAEALEGYNDPYAELARLDFLLPNPTLHLNFIPMPQSTQAPGAATEAADWLESQEPHFVPQYLHDFNENAHLPPIGQGPFLQFYANDPVFVQTDSNGNLSARHLEIRDGPIQHARLAPTPSNHDLGGFVPNHALQGFADAGQEHHRQLVNSPILVQPYDIRYPPPRETLPAFSYGFAEEEQRPDDQVYPTINSDVEQVAENRGRGRARGRPRGRGRNRTNNNRQNRRRDPDEASPDRRSRSPTVANSPPSFENRHRPWRAQLG